MIFKEGRIPDSFEVERKGAIWGKKKMHVQYYNTFIFKKNSKPMILAF